MYAIVLKVETEAVNYGGFTDFKKGRVMAWKKVQRKRHL
jgi:hypothetical protein